MISWGGVEIECGLWQAFALDVCEKLWSLPGRAACRHPGMRLVALC